MRLERRVEADRCTQRTTGGIRTIAHTHLNGLKPPLGRYRATPVKDPAVLLQQLDGSDSLLDGSRCDRAETTAHDNTSRQQLVAPGRLSFKLDDWKSE